MGSADPMLNAANNNLNTFRLYIPANYIAVASLWLQDPATGAVVGHAYRRARHIAPTYAARWAVPMLTRFFGIQGLSEWTGAIPSEAYYNANNQYPAWQNESWQKRALPKVRRCPTSRSEKAALLKLLLPQR